MKSYPIPTARRRSGIILLLVGLAVAGCSSRPVVTGKVTYKGKTLSAGEVSFVSADGKSRSGVIGSDGIYEVIDPPTGDVTIVVVSKTTEGPAKGSPLFGGTGMAPKVRSLIPTRYNEARTSGLTYHVKPGRQGKDIVLED